MASFDKQPILNIAEQCSQHGVQTFIISPGSRSAPLTAALAHHPEICCRVVMDERAAAFIALGLAQQTQHPVGLVCTSGSAGLNYAPAVAESYYQRIPLLVFTADRPPEWIDQQDGQTIRQTDLYGSHIRAAFQLPVDYSHPDATWHIERTISEAISTSMWPIPGPVQINIPLREPLYPPPDQPISSNTHRRLIQTVRPVSSLPEDTWLELQSIWTRSEKKLVLAGLHPFDTVLSESLNTLSKENDIVVIGDLTANMHQLVTKVPHWDMIIATKSTDIREALRPDLLITFGGQIVSKVVKQYLRQYKPKYHWHLDPSGQVIDTFQSLTHVLPIAPAHFFADLLGRLDSWGLESASVYADQWLSLEKKAADTLHAFFSDVLFGEFSAVKQVLDALPEQSYLQLANSMPVRYANYIGLNGCQIEVNANRGTSGIDGVISTAVGAALATSRLTTVITGDLAFFYDRNALWHNHVPPNLRIVILNNQGGGIFKLIDGPNNLPSNTLLEFFETPHTLNAKNTASDHGCDYYFCDTADNLAQALTSFFDPKTRPAILEIKTDRERNTDVFSIFKKRMAG
ncbi:MAG: 2-succinyl-5-enolpyruvyl-6-hydroxy-3-cyclohexene-1-carboxylic-acid synthase [Chloroflexota bacterium]